MKDNIKQYPEEIISDSGKYKAILRKDLPGYYIIEDTERENYKLTYSTKYKTVLELFNYWESGLSFIQWEREKKEKERGENGK